MFLFYRVSLVLVLSLVLAHSRHENLFSIDSTDFLNAPSDDASPLWNSDEITPDSTGLTLNSLDQGVNFMSDTESNGNSNDLFASSSMDLIALPSCEAEGSLTDGILKARDGESCQPRESIGSPTDLFQDLRDSLSAPTKERNNQAGQGDPKDENRNVIFGISGFMEDEELCPTEIFGPSNIPVCRNPFTGRMVEEAGSYAVTLYNVLQCRCFFTQVAPFVELVAIADYSQIPLNASNFQCFFAVQY